jgi:hypothetical protein
MLLKRFFIELIPIVSFFANPPVIMSSDAFEEEDDMIRTTSSAVSSRINSDTSQRRCLPSVGSRKEHLEEKVKNPILSGWDASEIEEMGGDLFDWSKPLPLRMNVHQEALEEVEKSPTSTCSKRNSRISSTHNKESQRKINMTFAKVQAETFSSSFRNLLQNTNKRDVLTAHGTRRTTNNSTTTPQQRQFTSKLMQIVSRNDFSEATSERYQQVENHPKPFRGRSHPNRGENNLCVAILAVPSVLKKEKEEKEKQEKNKKIGVNKRQGLPLLQPNQNGSQVSMSMFTTTTLSLPFDNQKVAPSFNNNNQRNSSNNNHGVSFLDELEKEYKRRKNKYDRHGGKEGRIFPWTSSEHIDIETSQLKSKTPLPAKLCKKDPLIQGGSSSFVPSQKHHAKETCQQLVEEYAIGSLPENVQSNYCTINPDSMTSRLKPNELFPRRSSTACSVFRRTFLLEKSNALR